MNNIIKQILYLYDLNNTVSQIAEILNITPHKVRRTLNKHGIYLGHKTPFKANPQIVISSLMEEIITGSMLGDGFMYKYIVDSGNKNCNSRLMINYSCINQEYGEYIKSLIDSTNIKTYSKISIRKNPAIINNRIIKDSGLYSIYTEQNQAFNKYRDIWYPFGIKYVPSDIKLTPLSIAIWFQDDGYYKKSSKTYMFCTDCFSYGDLKVLQNILLDSFGIKTIITSRRRLYIKRESANSFKLIIEPFICSSMKYKLG